MPVLGAADQRWLLWDGKQLASALQEYRVSFAHPESKGIRIKGSFVSL